MLSTIKNKINKSNQKTSMNYLDKTKTIIIIITLN